MHDYNKIIKQITLSLMVFSLLMLASCSGGSGGGGSVGSDGNSSMDNGDMIGDNNGDGGSGGDSNNGTGNNGNGGGSNNGTGNNGNGNGGELNIPAQAEWIIMPLAGGLSIQWHNLNNFTQMNAPQRLSINLTRSDTSVKQTHTIDISDFINGIYQLTGLEDGIAYKFASMIELEYGGSISHSRPISLLLEFNRLDNVHNAVNGIVVGANHDGDGRADGVDADDDNDGKPDDMDACRLGEIGWNSDNTTLDYDSDGCRNDEDIDDDGDGLIEIGTAEELNAVRYVLDGTGFKANETAMLDQTGCGNSSAITDCSGYELVGNISLTGYIAETYGTAGWRPIASDIDGSNELCDGDGFTAMFDGNGFEVRGLWINRSTEDCIGLFGLVSGTIRHLGVMVDRIEGRNYVGGLVGWGSFADIIQSYAVTGEVRGIGGVGGLVGWGSSADMVRSYAVTGEVRGSGWYVGGLVGFGNSADMVRSYAVTGEVRGGDTYVGGLVGSGVSTDMVHSYAVTGEVKGGDAVGGLVGSGTAGFSVQSYAVSGSVSGSSNVGGLVGFGGSARASYWDTEASGRTNSATGSGQNTSALRSPTGYTDIYATWDDGAMVEAIDDDTTIWCDEDMSGMIEDDERRGGSDMTGDNRVWHFGTADDYPALRCTGDSLADQRAWWFLNITSHKPQLNQTRLDAYLDGSLN